ncbi:MAG: NAD+ synthase [Phycisphaerae bacterium]|nr:NAD+ synthase [Phycisphaerae bacterium]
MRFALAQLNVTVGDLAGNRRKMEDSLRAATEKGADLLVFSELALSGYPPEDLLLRPRFLRDCQASLHTLAKQTGSMTMVAGFPDGMPDKCYNAAAVCRNGKVVSVYHKGLLPNYGVFDEKRYFVPGASPVFLEIAGVRAALTICEDVWDIEWLDSFLNGDSQKPELILNISASPFHVGKIHQRKETLARCAMHFGCPVAYCNQVGGQDELVFTGRSMVLDAAGKVCAEAAEFEEDLLIVDGAKTDNGVVLTLPFSAYVERHYDPLEEVYHALVLGTRDYVHKSGFSKVVIGLSGGIDSALVAAMAVEALGADNVVGVTMPSRFNSAETQADAKRLADNLGITFYALPIGAMLEPFSKTLTGVPGWDEKGLAYENLQARIRGTLLMSLSNQFGWMVLTTGNKSETAVGYSTLYGDTAGGFAVIKDVPKTMVYRLCDYINARFGREVIPQTTITRIPSAELRDNQKDSDSLPDYPVLDALLKDYIEHDQSPMELIESGYDQALVKRVVRMIDRSEYKRRQSPPGIKITPKAFGKDRRMPITNRYIP